MGVFDPSSTVATADAVEIAAEDHEMSTLIFAIALACGIWYFFILVVQAIGFTQLYVESLDIDRALLIIIQISILLFQATACCLSNVEARRCSSYYNS